MLEQCQKIKNYQQWPYSTSCGMCKMAAIAQTSHTHCGVVMISVRRPWPKFELKPGHESS